MEEILSEEEQCRKVNREFDLSVSISRVLREARNDDMEIELIRQFLLELNVKFENVEDALYKAALDSLR
jgi:uncharacterized protein YjaG (DUF416 family)